MSILLLLCNIVRKFMPRDLFAVFLIRSRYARTCVHKPGKYIVQPVSSEHASRSFART